MVAKILEIQIAETAGAPMQSLRSVRALKHLGLEGDRYATEKGTYSPWDLGEDKIKNVTIFEAEVLEDIRARLNLTFAHTRRNLLTRGVRLEDLQGRQYFRIGGAFFRPLQRCEPCQILGRLSGDPMLKENLFGELAARAGIYASVFETGVFSVGDEIVVV